MHRRNASSKRSSSFAKDCLAISGGNPGLGGRQLIRSSPGRKRAGQPSIKFDAHLAVSGQDIALPSLCSTSRAQVDIFKLINLCILYLIKITKFKSLFFISYLTICYFQIYYFHIFRCTRSRISAQERG